MFENEIDLIQNVKPDDFGMILNAILHISKEGIFVADHRGNIVLVNEASARMNGLSIKKLLEKNVRDLLKEGYCNRSATLEVLREKKTVSLININIEDKKILTTGIPIFNDYGKIAYVFVNERDLSFLNKLSILLEEDHCLEDPSNIECFDSTLVREELEGFVYKSVDMQIVLQTAIQAAEFDLDVVVTGETGVGKGFISKLIHNLSERRSKPFVDVNCGAIPEHLFESEVFGYEGGAFTGARTKGKIGYFEYAINGTLFLDEVGDIPLSSQVKLLKALENKEIVRVGSIKPIKTNTRIIAATNRDLKELVRSGKFREDLYFRLNVIPIRVPPLRKRKADIGPLINLFMDRFNDKYNKTIQISNDLIDALMEHQFPGNVRELENLIKRLITMASGNIISREDLPKSILNSLYQDSKISVSSQETFKNAVLEFEANLIRKSIKKFGSQKKAAQKLGIDQSTISRKLKSAPHNRLVHDKPER